MTVCIINDSKRFFIQNNVFLAPVQSTLIRKKKKKKSRNLALKRHSVMKLKCKYSRNYGNILIEHTRKIMQICGIRIKVSFSSIMWKTELYIFVCELKSLNPTISECRWQFYLICWFSLVQSEKEIQMLPAQVLLHVLSQKTVNYNMTQITFK